MPKKSPAKKRQRRPGCAGFFCELPVKTIKRIATLARSYKLPQWAIVEQGVKMVKARK